jgi:hypothetical protein
MKDEQYFNPFGPNFLTSTLEEDVRLKLLECIKDHSTNMWEDPSVISSYSAQKNSIVDGMLGDIKPEWQDKYHGNIIMKTISKLLNRYCELANMPEVVPDILNVWYVIMKSGDFHLIHNHTPKDKPYCKLSGSIYLDVPTNLLYPQGNINWIVSGAPTVSTHLYNPIWGVSPKLGQVFLWPSWIMHTVYPFRSEQERIMISFNGGWNE